MPAHRSLPDDQIAALFHQHHRLPHHWALRLAADLADPEDLAQAALLRAWRRRHGYDPDRPTCNGNPPFLAWLKWSFLAVLQDVRRRKERREELAAVGRLTTCPAKAGTPPDLVLTAETEAAVRKALDRLPPKVRALVVGRAEGKKLPQLMPGVSRYAALRVYEAALAELRVVLRSAG